MPRPPGSSHHRRRVIVAPESPPVTPPSHAPTRPGRGDSSPYQPSRPRAIVQRSNFAIQNPSAVSSARSSRNNPGQHGVPAPSRQSHFSAGGVGTPVFKLDEDMQNSFNVRRHGYYRQTNGRSGQHGMRRSESLEALPTEEDLKNARYSESEPPTACVLAQAGSSRRQSVTPSSSRYSLELPRPTGRRTAMATSAPIKIPSRAKQEEERQKRAAAAAKAKAVTAHNSRSSRVFFRSKRPVHAEPRYGLNYSSSEDSLEDLATKRR